LEVQPTPFEERTSLSRLSLAHNLFSEVKSPEEVYIKSRIGEGEGPHVLPLPLFIPAHTYHPLNEEARRAVMVFSIKSGIPLFVHPDFLDKELLDALDNLTYFLVLSPQEGLPQGEILKSAAGVVIDLTHRLTGDLSSYGEMKDPKDMVKLVKLLHDLTSKVLVQIPSSSVFHLTGLSALSGADGVVLTTATAPLGYKDSFVKPPNLIGDLEALSESYLALEELRPRGVSTSILLDGGVRGVDDLLKAVSMGARAVSLSGLLLTWLGCRMCTRCERVSCPVSILRGSGKPTRGWDELAENLLDTLSKFERQVKLHLASMGFKGIQELSRKNLIALDREAAFVTSLPLAGLGRRVEEG
ncbi:MAG: hypothetical protein J7L88_06275, partial [Thermoplasmata archaeon]|nr:hypothetical protein [Thermoplasmata archaeon]